MINTLKDILKKHREIISYVIFGALTTLVDFVTYIFLTRVFSLNEDLANVFSQVVAIIFAFVVNKLYVFEDKEKKLRAIIFQFLKFSSLRLITLTLNSLIFFVMTEFTTINDIIVKAFVSIIVIILNYIFSKLLVFKKTKE